ncbi:MAG TPA: acyloxyacyl hydrolase [Flavobacteriales bacterium]|nr:acyloxyacyl hydrolase [Flavobacteriales bacterium]HIA12737.1 acyloxyacyl hydrolase [Flavobacteriales bacterium]HIO73469.1 acyloxyacyl hydrolase [Flavobacteriales bacterium]
MKQRFIALFVFFLPLGANAQTATDTLALASDSNMKSQFILGIRQHYGFILIHSKAVRNIKDSYPWGTEIILNWHKMNLKSWEICNCYPRVGLLISFFDFDNPAILGYGLNVVGFVEPWFKSHKRFNITLRPAAGLSFNTRPYDAVKNPDNQSYSLPVNVYIQLSFALNYRINKNYGINFAANYNHISNGGIKEPNKGINYPTASVGIEYNFNPAPFKDRLKQKYQGIKKRRYDFAIFSFAKRIGGNSSYFGVYGVMSEFSQQVSRMNAVRLGAEWVWDNSLKWRLENQLNLDADYQRGALFIGHEFLMGRFIFSQDLAIYFYDQTKYNDPVYQRYGLNYKLGDRVFIGMHLKAHLHVADLIVIRLGLSL